jgi:uncharacterized protein YndB with AHSA1/START domain
MKRIGAVQVTLPSEREISLTRVFDAPRKLVFEAYTRPELLKRWLGVMEGWSMAVCEVDLRVGGTYRYVWHGPGGAEMGMRGTFREIVPLERIVTTEAFDQAWYEGQCIGTVTFDEQGGKTTITMSLRYDSQKIRDAVLKSPMAEGVAAGFDALAKMLATKTPEVSL